MTVVAKRANKKAKPKPPVVVTREFPPGTLIVAPGTPGAVVVSPRTPFCTHCRKNDKVSRSSHDRKTTYYRCTRCVDPDTMDYWIFKVRRAEKPRGPA